MNKSTCITILGLTLAFLLSSIQPIQAQLADSPWPKFQHDLRNTGRSQYRGAQDNKLRWSYVVAGSIWTSPTIGSGGTVYLGDHTENVFYALNPDGSVKLTIPVKGESGTSPAIATDGTIHIGFRYLFYGLCALNPDGSEKWLFPTEGAVFSSPAIATDATVYFGSRDNKFYALNPDGTEKWSFSTGGRIGSSPAIGNDGTIYFGSNDNKFYALNPNGTEKWSYLTGGAVYYPPVIGADGTIYISSEDGNLYALYENGYLKWFYLVGYSGLSPAIAADATIYVGAYDNELDGYLHALRDDGDHATLKWVFPVGHLSAPTPIVDNEGTIYFGSDKTFYALNPDNTIKWTFTVSGEYETFNFTSPVIGADNTIYAVSSRAIYAIGTPTGQPEQPSDQTEDTIPAQPDNTALIAGAAGAIIVLSAFIFWLRRRSVKQI